MAASAANTSMMLRAHFENYMESEKRDLGSEEIIMTAIADHPSAGLWCVAAMVEFPKRVLQSTTAEKLSTTCRQFEQCLEYWELLASAVILKTCDVQHGLLQRAAALPVAATAEQNAAGAPEAS